MLLRGIAAGFAGVSRALPSALPTVVHYNAIPGNSGHATCQDGIKSRTSSAIGIIFLAATLAALPRSGAAWGGEQATSVQEHTRSMGEQIVGTWRLELDLRGGRRRRRD